ncbi:MAG TPA: Ig-like domain-containing protein [Gemmatimonadales bacterium]|nr:Ig-like domain-containing protein [Gemmatimonadales bacterium]
MNPTTSAPTGFALPRAALAMLGAVGVSALAACAGEPVEPTPTVPVASVVVVPATPVVGVGAAAPLTAVTLNAGGDTLPRRRIAWASADPAVATVDAAGVATGVAAGSARITATSEGRSGSVTLTVSTTRVAAVQVAPATLRLSTGATATLTGTALDGGGAPLPGRVFAWASSAPGVAEVSASGAVRGVSAGSATIRGTSEGQHADVTVAVTRAAVATVTITPAGASVGLGDTLQLTAVAKDAAGNVLGDRTVSWTSADPTIAVVSPAGAVRGRAPGRVTITAAAEGATGMAAVVVALRFSAVSAGQDFTCGVTPVATAFCWGRDVNGSLGGAGGDRNAPAAVSLPPGVQFDSVSAGADHACALSAQGGVWCWGTNTFGQLGDGTLINSGTPVLARTPAGLEFVAVSAGAEFTCALATTHVAYCWGLNDSGQLGNATNVATNTPNPTPLEVGGGPFASLGATQGHVCAVGDNSNSLAFCWGSNLTGELGRGGSAGTGDFVPAPVLGSSPYATVAGGFGFSCGIQTGGGAFCWGSNGAGELGTSTPFTTQTFPVAVDGGHTFTQLSTGQALACGVSTSGAGFCWGSDAFGQVGDGTTGGTPITPAPQAVAGGIAFIAIDAGYTHACGVAADHRAYCWGRAQPGAHGGASALGDGKSADSNVPVLVATQ